LDRKNKIDRKAYSESAAVIIILIVAAALRFWGLQQLPLMHDEFSALFRTQYNSFGDLIRLGVIQNDSHPAGVQVFLFYWVKLFGFNEFWIKLPFALMGTASIYFIYRIANQWFGKLSGLLSAAFIAAIQFSIFHSQLARPYAAGLFFVLLQVFVLSRWMASTRKPKKASVLAFALVCWLAALMHAFSLALAGLIYLSGLYLIQKRDRKPYLIAGLLAVLFYTPHITVFYAQLMAGGIGDWLGKPDNDFLWSFLFYAANYSWFLVLILGAVFAFPFLLRQAKISSRNRLRFVALLWFFVPLAIAWTYSLLRTPILQYSTLYFGFPFLIMVFFSFFDDKSFGKKTVFILSMTVLFVASFTTIFERQHPRQMQKQGFDQLAVYMDSAQQQYGPDISLSSYSATPAMAAFYQQRLGLETKVKRFSKQSTLQDFGDWLAAQNQDFLGFGWTDYAAVEWELLSAWFYPYELQHKAWFNACWFVRAKSEMRFSSEAMPLLTIENIVEHQEYQKDSLLFDATRTYGAPLKWDSDKLDSDINLFGVGAYVLQSAQIKELRLVLEVRDNATDSLLFWKAGTVDKSWQANDELVLMAAFRFSNIGLKPKNSYVKAYLWNKGDEAFRLVNMFSYQREQHPHVLGLIEPL
jgi:hypothetical protein